MYADVTSSGKRVLEAGYVQHMDLFAPPSRDTLGFESFTPGDYKAKDLSVGNGLTRKDENTHPIVVKDAPLDLL